MITANWNLGPFSVLMVVGLIRHREREREKQRKNGRIRSSTTGFVCTVRGLLGGKTIMNILETVVTDVYYIVAELPVWLAYW